MEPPVTLNGKNTPEIRVYFWVQSIDTISDIRRLSELMSYSDCLVLFFLLFVLLSACDFHFFDNFLRKLANSENYTKSESFLQSAVCPHTIIHFLTALNGNETANGFQVSGFGTQIIIIYFKTCKKLTNKSINEIKQ